MLTLVAKICQDGRKFQVFDALLIIVEWFGPLMTFRQKSMMGFLVEESDSPFNVRKRETMRWLINRCHSEIFTRRPYSNRHWWTGEQHSGHETTMGKELGKFLAWLWRKLGQLIHIDRFACDTYDQKDSENREQRLFNKNTRLCKVRTRCIRPDACPAPGTQHSKVKAFEWNRQ